MRKTVGTLEDLTIALNAAIIQLEAPVEQCDGTLEDAVRAITELLEWYGSPVTPTGSLQNAVNIYNAAAQKVDVIIPNVNRDGVQYAALRFGTERLDDYFLDIIDTLEKCYYKRWRLGLPAKFAVWNVLPTPEENKAQFDFLHGLIWDAYTVVFHLINTHRPNPIPQEEYRYGYNEDGSVKTDFVQQSVDHIMAHPAIARRLRDEIDNRFGVTIHWSDLNL